MYKLHWLDLFYNKVCDNPFPQQIERVEFKQCSIGYQSALSGVLRRSHSVVKFYIAFICVVATRFC